jgi:hypothetical protein
MTDLAPHEPTGSLASRRQRAVNRAAMSAFIPGLGQLAQRRYVDAALQFGTVVAYAAGVYGLGGGRAVLAALAWNVWSVVDAFRYEGRD